MLLKPCILGSLPSTVPAEEEFLANILASLGDGRLTALVFYQGVGKEKKPLAVLTVVVLKDTIAKVNILRIYTLYGVAALPSGAWPALLTELRTYAANMDCSTIMAETINSKVVEVVAWLGGDASTRLILLPVKEC